MKNNKIYLITLFIALGFIVNSCDVNTEEYKAVSPVDSFVSTSASVIVDSDNVTFEVIVAASEAYTADRSVPIEIGSASTGSGLDYNFSGNVDIPAGQLTGSTTIKFNYDPITPNNERELVLRLVSTSEEITISYTKPVIFYDIELTINFDNFPTETSWEITDSSSSVVATSGGTYPGGSTVLNETISLVEGDYTFTIYDAFGDGLCCSWGIGNYELIEVAGGTTLAAGASFGASEATAFSLP
ncbi:MAG: hypothetical protein COA67_11920 [Lutibacter sp.]|nr:MAG: hypothetical protein COA67_11920 [Lutibacter sp.]